MTRPLLLTLLAHSAAASSLGDITRVERTLTFPGWRRLARETRHAYIKNGYSSGLETMELKQRLHDGDRSHPRVVAPTWRSMRLRQISATLVGAQMRRRRRWPVCSRVCRTNWSLRWRK